jgi:nucleotide-binding universal stress UspA family protein/nitrite reductase/ring-hydroxylating ferredoxin subunit
MTYKKILVGTDGSPTAAVAEVAASSLAKALMADLLILTAYDPAGTVEGKAGEVLHRAVSVSKELGVEARTETREGDPSDAIMEAAEDHTCDLIVLGSVGMGAARRFVLGGVPDRVAHYAPCDLLIVKTASRGESLPPPGIYRRVLIATDGSPTASQAARRGFDLARSVGASVTLVYVGDKLMGDIVLKETAERLGIEDGDVGARVLQGDPSDRISELAGTESHDLVVVGNKGMAGARRFLLGSVPNSVSHDAPTDVLISKTVGRSLDDLRPGEGAIVVFGGRRMAAYRDEEGKVHAVSARCTHLGCTVGWNDGARTWDCPCHGSRYDYGGKVLQGPAERDLAPIEADG